MTTTARPVPAPFDDWLAYYKDRFTRMGADALKRYWWLYGRDSEAAADPRELAAWAAVNQEMQARGL